LHGLEIILPWCRKTSSRSVMGISFQLKTGISEFPYSHILDRRLSELDHRQSRQSDLAMAHPSASLFMASPMGDSICINAFR